MCYGETKSIDAIQRFLDNGLAGNLWIFVGIDFIAIDFARKIISRHVAGRQNIVYVTPR